MKIPNITKETNEQFIKMNSYLSVSEQDCAVCLQKCHHPTQLPCGHIFCFLCVKGVTIQSKKCAMCRAEIPADYLDHPVLLEKLIPVITSIEQEGQYQWYYEGRNGWWKYDERSNTELEEKFSAGEGECTLLLAGALYCIDFQNMMQVRCSDVSRRRKVKRDTPALPSKGVAGIKSLDTINMEQTKSPDENRPSNSESQHAEIEIINIADNHEERENAGESEPVQPTISEFENVINRLSAIDLFESPPQAPSDLPDVEDT